MARSSIVGIDTQLEISVLLGYVKINELEGIESSIKNVFALLSGLVKSHKFYPFLLTINKNNSNKQRSIMEMKEKVKKLWPELEWIKNQELKEKVTDCWVYAIENSVLKPEDLEVIPFSLLIKDCTITFMNHKRTCVQLAVEIANIMQKNFGSAVKIDMDTLIAGAILIDVGKLLEYEMVDGKLKTSNYGNLVRHPFSGLGLAARFGLSPEIQHIIGTHSKEGDLGKRTVESIIVHHADFVSFDPFKA